ncbi:hypothetical protein HOG17_02330 [Candidatus Peregrinibacteria bacterium]|jgi:hypothetical protein|nr:hypothetical protein [Candidatus Peregrinibacteria bacterium]MBT4056442.1 hypothetical protein [Candidatus Peregrinibacteria bacterium]MBT4366016.1 hypothetical protein [Candidatus Peregrinibacteria bacterium]MBT4456374.1 hypothetical protein [Candidatus Peregrinibacteria bacterium]
MPTTKKRVNITLSEEIEKALELLADRDNVPVATKASELVKIAIEIDEADMLNMVAEERDTEKAKYISHDKAWS